MDDKIDFIIQYHDQPPFDTPALRKRKIISLPVEATLNDFVKELETLVSYGEIESIELVL